MNLSENVRWEEAAIIVRGKRAVTLASSIAPSLGRLPRWREWVKIHLRALAQPGPTQRWLALLNSHPALLECVALEPTAVRKIYRPYMTATLTTAQRLDVITSHYAFMFSHGLAGMLAQACRKGYQLASIMGKTGILYDVQLRAVGTCGREGELVLQLCCAGAVVYSVAFTFFTEAGATRVQIGCVQGARGADAMAAIKQATRELHGLRAKALLVGLVQQLGAALGCAELRLVGNANRTPGPALENGVVRADYEQFWLELGATRRSDGDFVLPCCALAPLVLDDVLQKRRSEARKRHQMLEGVTGDVITHFLCHGRPPVAAVELLAA
jgi:uncharacterized protein VirK/YbjX